MEQQKKLDYDSDIIICEDIPETISVSTSPETIKKPKKKKHKRKLKRDVNFNNNMETLLITQKFKVKTKFKCIININTVPVCEKRSDSIVRSHKEKSDSIVRSHKEKSDSIVRSHTEKSDSIVRSHKEKSDSIVRSHTEKSDSIARSHTEKSDSIVRFHTEKRSDSIVRSHTNVCNKEAYYHRIVPMCLRERCSGDSASCRRSTISRDHNKYMHPKVGSLSPVSSLPFTEAFCCNNLSYEDISNGSFSITSDEELDTLIKRTKQREKQIHISHPARKYTSTPTSKDENMASPFSIDTEKTIHSDNTMILNTLPTEAYSPMSFDVIKVDNIEIDDSLDINDIDVPYSPTMTPDLMKIENLDYSPVDKTSHDDGIPYSPTCTPESIKVVIMDDLEINSAIDMNQPYSPTFTPDIIEMEKLDNGNIEYGNEPYSPTMTPEIKMENYNNFTDKANENGTLNVGYSPRSPTMTPDYNKCSMTQTNNWNDFAVPNSATDSGIIKQENVDDEFTIIKNTITPKFAMLTPDFIKKENENHQGHLNETDYNMNNTNHYKSEKDDVQTGMHDQFNPNDTIVKIEKDYRT